MPRIHERSRVVEIAPGRVTTAGGTVLAENVVIATEGYTARLAGRRRAIAPVYSLMIATEPLPAQVWEEIGWSGRETLSDGRHLIIYAQRTADDRIAFGGRGAPYHFGSRIRDDFDRDRRVFAELRAVLHDLFPAVAGARITHEWGGPLGIPRDWYSSVGFDPVDAASDGPAGTSATASARPTWPAGRSPICSSARSPSSPRCPGSTIGPRTWEPEPLRWLGINAGLRLPAGADRFEARTGRSSRWRERLLAKLVG